MQWEALKEEWDEKHVLKLEYGDNVPSDMLVRHLSDCLGFRMFILINNNNSKEGDFWVMS